MRIGIDVDGVLNNIGDWHISYGKKFCVENNIVRPVSLNAYFVKDIFHLTKEERNTFLNRYMVDLVHNIPIRYFASEVIKELKRMGHTIVILTARDNDFLVGEHAGKIEEYTRNWLNKHDVLYDEIITSSHSKTNDCFANGIDIMIEDKDINIMDISMHMPVLCFDALHNQHINGVRVHRVYSWYDVLEYFKNLEPEKMVEDIEVI